MAELALWVADRVAVSARPQAQGYAWGFLGNARRVLRRVKLTQQGSPRSRQ